MADLKLKWEELSSNLKGPFKFYKFTAVIPSTKYIMIRYKNGFEKREKNSRLVVLTQKDGNIQIHSRKVFPRNLTGRLIKEGWSFVRGNVWEKAFVLRKEITAEVIYMLTELTKEK